MKYTVLAQYGNIAKDFVYDDINDVVVKLKELQGSSMLIHNGGCSSLAMLSNITLLVDNKYVDMEKVLLDNDIVLSDVVGKYY